MIARSRKFTPVRWGWLASLPLTLVLNGVRITPTLAQAQPCDPSTTSCPEDLSSSSPANSNAGIQNSSSPDSSTDAGAGGDPSNNSSTDAGAGGDPSYAADTCRDQANQEFKDCLKKIPGQIVGDVVKGAIRGCETVGAVSELAGPEAVLEGCATGALEEAGRTAIKQGGKKALICEAKRELANAQCPSDPSKADQTLPGPY